MKDTNHMHMSTHLIYTVSSNASWWIQLGGAARAPSRLEVLLDGMVSAASYHHRVQVSDPFTRYEHKFKTLEEAIEYCKLMGKWIDFIVVAGFGYNIQYPKWRYSSKQTYADNFKWKGFAKEDPDSWIMKYIIPIRISAKGKKNVF